MGSSSQHWHPADPPLTTLVIGFLTEQCMEMIYRRHITVTQKRSSLVHGSGVSEEHRL